MANANKRKGDAFELSIQRYLSERLDCERIPAGSTVDRGDLWTRTALIQCKNQKPLHALVIKRYRTTDPADQFCVMTLGQLRELLATVNNCDNPPVTDA
jgi:hypothetical protein